MSRFLLPILTLSILVACTPATQNGTDTTASSASSTSSIDAMEASSSTTSSSSSEVMQPSSPAATETRVIDMKVTDWSFTPSIINIKKGEKVVIRLSDEAGVHSFGVQDLGINVALAPGETKDVTIPTDIAGTFDFRCLIPCGPGHKDMKGTIVIS